MLVGGSTIGVQYFSLHLTTYYTVCLRLSLWPFPGSDSDLSGMSPRHALQFLNVSHN